MPRWRSSGVSSSVSGLLVVAIRSVHDVGKALGASLERGGLMLAEDDLCAELFDLRTARKVVVEPGNR